MKKLKRYTISTNYIEKETRTESGDMIIFTVPKKTYHFQNENYENEEDVIKAEELFIEKMTSQMVECPECYCETCFPEEDDTEDTMCDVCLQVEEIKKRIWTALEEIETDFKKIENSWYGKNGFWDLVKDLIDD